MLIHAGLRTCMDFLFGKKGFSKNFKRFYHKTDKYLLICFDIKDLHAFCLINLFKIVKYLNKIIQNK